MLVLSRMRDQSVIIRDDITVTVQDIRGERVRLGFTAPSDIIIHRLEVYEAVQRENRLAAYNGEPAPPPPSGRTARRVDELQSEVGRYRAKIAALEAANAELRRERDALTGKGKAKANRPIGPQQSLGEAIRAAARERQEREWKRDLSTDDPAALAGEAWGEDVPRGEC